jgi:hypothetical protein
MPSVSCSFKPHASLSAMAGKMAGVLYIITSICLFLIFPLCFLSPIHFVYNIELSNIKCKYYVCLLNKRCSLPVHLNTQTGMWKEKKMIEMCNPSGKWPEAASIFDFGNAELNFLLCLI